VADGVEIADHTQSQARLCAPEIIHLALPLLIGEIKRGSTQCLPTARASSGAGRSPEPVPVAGVQSHCNRKGDRQNQEKENGEENEDNRLAPSSQPFASAESAERSGRHQEQLLVRARRILCWCRPLCLCFILLSGLVLLSVLAENREIVASWRCFRGRGGSGRLFVVARSGQKGGGMAIAGPDHGSGCFR